MPSSEQGSVDEIVSKARHGSCSYRTRGLMGKMDMKQVISQINVSSQIAVNARNKMYQKAQHL